MKTKRLFCCRKLRQRSVREMHALFLHIISDKLSKENNLKIRGKLQNKIYLGIETRYTVILSRINFIYFYKVL